MILGTSTAHLVLNNLQQVLHLLQFSFRVFPGQREEKNLRETQKETFRVLNTEYGLSGDGGAGC